MGKIRPAPCKIDGCEGLVKGRGWCAMHYARWKRWGDPNIVQTGWRERRRKHPLTCTFEGCDLPTSNRGWCEKHYRRWRKWGDPAICMWEHLPDRWSTYADGYKGKMIGGKIVAQHRYVMEQHLGRNLLPHENVHHLNGDRGDNRIDNLELWSRSQPPGQRVADKIAWCLEFLSEEAPHLLAP